jgi:hypothetical protein
MANENNRLQPNTITGVQVSFGGKKNPSKMADFEL